jgi:dynein heavy chain 1
METMVPKLVAEDIPLLHSLLSDMFPGVAFVPGQMKALREELKKVCSEMHLTYGENDEQGTQWVEKVSEMPCSSQLCYCSLCKTRLACSFNRD